jgi:phage gp29-like protein
MARTPQLIDQWGNPLQRATLTTEVAAPTVGGVRSPVTGYPADGLNPQRLAAILREADAGDPIRYLELAETIEERDPHYLAVLGTRRRAVSQLDVTVEAASDEPEDVARADMVRDWLKRDELQDEMFQILDCLGKGYSATEIIWGWDGTRYWPERLERRDPRWFRFAQHDLTTPLMLTEYGQEQPLPAFKFIWAAIPAKSGLPLRSGLARVAAWGWMFKAYTQRDWAIFTQTFGQPLRVGKYGPGASERDRETLFRAVANIAGDCAAIIPESMQIDFVETGNLSASSDLYRDRADWLDQQISKAVLGQTATTDAVVGGLGSGAEHRQVQEDIERADAKALSAILNRQLIRPWMELNFGAGVACPRLIIARPEAEDLTAWTENVVRVVGLGLPVKRAEMYAKLGLEEPGPEDEILTGSAPGAPAADPEPRPSPFKRFSGEIKRVGPPAAVVAEPQADASPRGKSGASRPEADPVALLTAQLAAEAAPAIEAMLVRIEAMVGAAGSLEELRAMLLAAWPEIDDRTLSGVVARALVAGNLGGRAMLDAESV